MVVMRIEKSSDSERNCSETDFLTGLEDNREKIIEWTQEILEHK